MEAPTLDERDEQDLNDREESPTEEERLKILVTRNRLTAWFGS